MIEYGQLEDFLVMIFKCRPLYSLKSKIIANYHVLNDIQKYLFVTGKVFLNSIEQLDPLSDEWTTFLTMPEKLITPSKSLPVNVIHTDQLDTERQDAMTDLEHDQRDLTIPKVRENEDGILFEMDFDSVENRNVSHENTDPTKDISSSLKKDEILRESISHTQKSPAESDQNIDNDQSATEMAEPISKHVLR